MGHTKVQKRAKKSIYFGIFYNEKEETAAHASDTLAKRLMADGNQNLKLNFPDVDTEADLEHQANKRKRPFDCEYSEANEDNFENFEETTNENSTKYRAFLGSGFK